MLKALAAIAVAVTIAATITLLSAPITNVVAGPLLKPTADAMKACNEQPWPYSNCIGTEFDNPKVRLITINRAG